MTFKTFEFTQESSTYSLQITPITLEAEINRRIQSFTRCTTLPRELWNPQAGYCDPRLRILRGKTRNRRVAVCGSQRSSRQSFLLGWTELYERVRDADSQAFWKSLQLITRKVQGLKVGQVAQALR